MVLTDDEYKILQDLYDDGFHWIARDKYRLIAFRYEPQKLEDEWYDDNSFNYAILYYIKSLFPYISIGELYNIKEILK